MSERIQVWIDGRPYAVEAGDNLLQACLSLGFDLPYFCWHPALGSVGACRQCAIKQFRDEDDPEGRLVMACMTGAEDGMRVSIEDPEARDFRASVIEWLMTSHPHDCPVCDEGGECHLQDMTVMTGHAYRRFRFRKRTFRNQYLGPFLNHEMNRCITCYRCVRFYRDHAGGRDLEAFATHDEVYFGRHEDGVLENEFSGNLVEVCPTGVFTDKTLKAHYTRKWDLQSAPSVCVHCAVGCNVFAGERYGSVRRILNRYNSEVNGYFLCDRGRFGYEFLNREDRVRTPLVRGAEGLVPVPREPALERLAALLSGGRALGIGSPRASLESIYALQRLLGSERFHQGTGRTERELLETAVEVLGRGPARSASLADVRRSDAVLVLGEDPTMTAPVVALALRQAARVAPARAAAELNIPAWHDAAVREVIQDRRGPFFVATPAPTRLDELATRTLRATPGELALLGFALAHALDREAPAPASVPAPILSMAREVATALARAERPLVVVGGASCSARLVEAGAQAAHVLGERGRLAVTLPECNSLGGALLGGETLEDAFAAAERGEVDTAIVLENDLYRRAPRETIDRFLNAVPHLVVLDHVLSATAARAELVLPAAAFAEGDGTLVNAEGRVQRFVQVYPPAKPIEESWRWLGAIGELAGARRGGPWSDHAAIVEALAQDHPVLAPVASLVPQPPLPSGAGVPREPHRYSGRTAIGAHLDVHEPPPPSDPDSPLRFSMEGASSVSTPPALAPFYWSPGWNSVQALNKLQKEVGGPLRGGDPGVRLLEPGRTARWAEPDPDGEAAAEPTAAFLVVPLPQIFGSEELSARAPAVAERSPEPFVALRGEDAALLGLTAGDPVELRVREEVLRLPLRLEDGLAPKAAGLSVGLAGVPYLELPAAGEVRAA